MSDAPAPTDLLCGAAAREALAACSPVAAARRLLGAELLRPDGLRVRLVEVEAYGGGEDGPWPDPAAHSYRGLTPRVATMFGPAGHLYVYRSYGIHLCGNVTYGPLDVAGAVLIRAVEILHGRERARERRGHRVPESGLGRGPGNVGRALALCPEEDGADLCAPGTTMTGTVLLVPAVPLDAEIDSGPRVGVARAATRPWRLWLVGHPAVSAYRRGGRPGDGGQ